MVLFVVLTDVNDLCDFVVGTKLQTPNVHLVTCRKHSISLSLFWGEEGIIIDIAEREARVSASVPVCIYISNTINNIGT